MAHPLVEQLRFARREFVRCLDGVSANDAQTHVGQMNCISWVIGHLAAQEHHYFVFLAQHKTDYPDLNKIVGYGSPKSAPNLDEMWSTWRDITTIADDYLETLDTETLQTYFEYDGQPVRESIGTMIHRTLYHYWFHIGEVHAIRQMLGHQDLPQFVGNMSDIPYTPH